MSSYRRSILTDAVDTYGEDSQLLMVAEESTELAQAVLQLVRGRDVTRKLAGEVADVVIMLEQLHVIMTRQMGDFWADLVAERTQEKLTRLKTRLEEAKRCRG